MMESREFIYLVEINKTGNASIAKNVNPPDEEKL